MTKATRITVIFNHLIYFEMFSGYSCCLDSPQGKMIMQDKLEKERNDAKNNVEEYVYDMRDKLHGMLEKFVSEAVSKRLSLARCKGSVMLLRSDDRRMRVIRSGLYIHTSPTCLHGLQ